MKNVHLIPTDKPSRIRIGNNGNFVFGLIQNSIASKNDSYTNQNIYITSDEEIKEGDYVTNGKYTSQAINEWWTKFYIGNPELKADYWKIILSTDQDLIADGVQTIDDEFLEWFVKNPSCEFIEVEDWHNKFLSCCRSKEECHCNKKRIIIPQEEPKQELPQLGTKEFNDLASAYFGGELNDLASAYFGGKPKQEELKFKNRQIGAAGFVANKIMENMINKSKQETLEEDLLDTAIQVIGSNSVVTIKEFFIKNNWQQERMYSEEDLLSAFEAGMMFIGEDKGSFREWFEQFKKK
jgi:hypothetical protein